MGYKPWEYYRLTFREYNSAVTGYFTRLSKEYEHTRAICYVIASVNRDPKKRMPPINKFWPLPTDEEYSAPTAERAAQLKEKLSRVEAMMKKRINKSNG